MESYLEQLNEAQKQAVVNIKGPSLVIAGAGSGKTRVLTYRIAHLIRNGVRPSSILALTFTNKAAREMKERIAQIVGYDTAKYLWMGTFHSIFSRILRSEAEALKYPKDFTIYDTQDSKSLLKTVIKELHLNTDLYKVSTIQGRISKAKNNLLTAQAYAKNSNLLINDAKQKVPQFHKVFTEYAKRCFVSGAMDFDDLLLLTNVLFRDNPAILDKYRQHFKYILVDEYQDTNFSQYLIIKKLSEEHKNLCVVGDDAQSIYSFRGAKIENILNFQRDYPTSQTFKLEQNYRSTQNIVKAANSLIEKNKKQLKKNTFSENTEGSKIEVIRTITDKEEGLRTASKIMELRMSDHFEFKDFAILYRTNSQSRIFEESLRKHNIPYKIFGGLSFYQRKEIKDILSYCRLIVNPNDNEAFKRVVNYPKRGIGATTMGKLELLAAKNEISIWETIPRIKPEDKIVAKATLTKLKNFVELIKQFRLYAEEKNAFDTTRFIAKETGILKELHNEKSVEGLTRYENVQELLNGIRVYVDERLQQGESVHLSNFLEEVALITDQDTEKDEDKNKVVMMTIHSSKGLEFKNVFIVGVEEDLFPSFMSSSSQQELEEERRLFYVAITRAEANLYISYTENRYRWGQLKIAKPSRFIGEIDQKYLDISDSDFIPDFTSSKKFDDYSFEKKDRSSEKRPAFSVKKKEPVKPFTGKREVAQPKNQFFNKNKLSKVTKSGAINSEADFKSNAGLQVGSIVEHSRFGKGKVLKLEGSVPNRKASIDFAAAGTKQLLLKFAKLKVIK